MTTRDSNDRTRLTDDSIKLIINETRDAVRDANSREWIGMQMAEEIAEIGLRRYYYERFLNGMYGWNSIRYAEYRREQEEFDDYIFKPVDVVEGVLQCNKCGSRKILSTSSQTRSADEPMTVFAKCTQCKRKWIAS